MDKVKDPFIRPNDILASFDVESLYPSIPVDEALEMLKEWLADQDLSQEEQDMYLEMTTVCMSLNYFQFDFKYYQQTYDMAMGNALSPFLANLYMSNFEIRLKKAKCFPEIWVRYVDDIFVVINKRKLSSTLQLLNKQHLSIKFTSEEEVEASLPFLDVKVTKMGNSLEFDVYRKPTNTQRCIPASSCHPNQHKLAAFHSMIHRACNLPLSEESLSRELKYIKDTAKVNGYSEVMVDRLLKKHLAKKRIKDATILVPLAKEDKLK